MTALLLSEEEIGKLGAAAENLRFESNGGARRLSLKSVGRGMSSLGAMVGLAAKDPPTSGPSTTVSNTKARQQLGLEALPTGSSWLRYQGGLLDQALELVTLVDVRWLIKLGRAHKVLPPWQALPPEAIATPEALHHYTGEDSLPVFALSYPWWELSHPDAHGEQLQLLLPIFELIEKHLDANGGCDATFGVLWDFCSFPQKGWSAASGARFLPPADDGDDRTPAQLQQFRKGLSVLNLFYMHPYVITFRLDIPIGPLAVNDRPYEQRGWCEFETRLSEVVKDNYNLLSYSKFDPSWMVSWERMRGADSYSNLGCKLGRQPPMTPDAFAQMMRTRSSGDRPSLAFTSPVDLERIVIPSYERGFRTALSTATKLVYNELSWGDDDMTAVAACLAYARMHALVENLQVVNLARNLITLAGAAAVADECRQLMSSSDQFEALSLHHNPCAEPAAELEAFLLERLGSGSVVRGVWKRDRLDVIKREASDNRRTASNERRTEPEEATPPGSAFTAGLADSLLSYLAPAAAPAEAAVNGQSRSSSLRVDGRRSSVRMGLLVASTNALAAEQLLHDGNVHTALPERELSILPQRRGSGNADGKADKDGSQEDLLAPATAPTRGSKPGGKPGGVRVSLFSRPKATRLSSDARAQPRRSTIASMLPFGSTGLRPTSV